MIRSVTQTDLPEVGNVSCRLARLGQVDLREQRTGWEWDAECTESGSGGKRKEGRLANTKIM